MDNKNSLFQNFRKQSKRSRLKYNLTWGQTAGVFILQGFQTKKHKQRQRAQQGYTAMHKCSLVIKLKNREGV
jgi:hypothetical protein